MASSEWYKDQFFISTKPSLIQPAAVNAALDSDLIYWAKGIRDETLLKKTLDNSLCFGLYELPSSSSDIAGRSNPKQIGLARLITDEVTFAYLTDVYVLAEYQGKGFGKWLIECVNETLGSWPELRRAMLVTTQGSKLYVDTLGMSEFQQGQNGLSVFQKRGPASLKADVDF